MQISKISLPSGRQMFKGYDYMTNSVGKTVPYFYQSIDSERYECVQEFYKIKDGKIQKEAPFYSIKYEGKAIPVNFDKFFNDSEKNSPVATTVKVRDKKTGEIFQ